MNEQLAPPQKEHAEPVSHATFRLAQVGQSYEARCLECTVAVLTMQVPSVDIHAFTAAAIDAATSHHVSNCTVGTHEERRAAHRNRSGEVERAKPEEASDGIIATLRLSWVTDVQSMKGGPWNS